MTHLSTLVEIAAELRLRAGQTKPPFSTTAIVRECFVGAAVTGRELPHGIDEIVTRTKDGPLIVYRRGISTAEQRLAIAHGVAHLIFDDEDVAARIGSVGDPSCEARADRFAAELLVPLNHLVRIARQWPSRNVSREIYLDHVDQIAARFGVPAPVIDQRIRRLERTAQLYG